jgi:prepilin-type N-terminal cleavage/methylation domain-containing protein
MNFANRSRGFTLIELLVVIAIIGILSSVVLASLNTARKKGRDARRISDIKQLQLALELYYDTQQSYPVTASGGGGASTTLTTLVTNNFISSIPSDPTNAGAYIYEYASANGTDGSACTSAPCSSYVLKAVIEGGATAVPAGDVDDEWAGIGTDECDDPAYCMKP